MTYRELAKLAGVSVATVSKALAGNSELSQETILHIQKLALENGVGRPSYYHDKNLLVVDIIVPELISSYYASILTTITDILWKYKIEPNIHICGFNSQKFCKIIESIREQGVSRGIISLGAHYYYPEKLDTHILYLFECTELLPVIQNYTDPNQSSGFPQNIPDGLSCGMAKAFEHLISMGHTDIGFIGERNTVHKMKYFLAEAERCGLSVNNDFIYTSNKRFEEIGYEAVKYLLSLPSLPTALIAAYDEVALGAINAFTKNGIHVPKDISIIGINNIPCASYASVSLTTLSPNIKDSLSLFIPKFIESIRNRNASVLQYSLCLQWNLIVRDSTAKPRR